MGSASRGNRLAASCVGLPPSSGRMQLGRFFADCWSAHARIHGQSTGSAVCSKPAVPLFLGFPAPRKSDLVWRERSPPRFAACVFHMPGLPDAPRFVQTFERWRAFPGNNGSRATIAPMRHCATVCRARCHATKYNDWTARPVARMRRSPKVICSNLRPPFHPEAARTDNCTGPNLGVPVRAGTRSGTPRPRSAPPPRRHSGDRVRGEAHLI
jgi:hypothetical protein